MSDFILKPYNIEHLKEVVDRLIHQHREKRKEQQQHDELLEKIEKITPVVENECLYAIISNENELELKRSLRLLSPHICSGFCMIMQSLTCAFHTTAMDTICENFKSRDIAVSKNCFMDCKFSLSFLSVRLTNRKSDSWQDISMVCVVNIKMS